MTPFFPTRQSAGRSKAIRWEEDSYVDYSDDDYVSSTTPLSYRDAVYGAIEGLASPMPVVPSNGDSSMDLTAASHPVVINKKR